MHNQFMVPFTITATNVNLADSTPYTVATFTDDNSNIIKVPTRLEIQKAAGTAYTVTDPDVLTRSREGEKGDIVSEKFRTNNYANLFGGGSWLVVEAVDDDGQSRPYFYTPLEGFLDQATVQKRMVFPVTEGMTFGTPPTPTSFRLRLTRNVASGTGSVSGRLFFDEYTVGGF